MNIVILIMHDETKIAIERGYVLSHSETKVYVDRKTVQGRSPKTMLCAPGFNLR